MRGCDFVTNNLPHLPSVSTCSNSFTLINQEDLSMCTTYFPWFRLRRHAGLSSLKSKHNHWGASGPLIQITDSPRSPGAGHASRNTKAASSTSPKLETVTMMLEAVDFPRDKMAKQKEKVVENDPDTNRSSGRGSIEVRHRLKRPCGFIIFLHGEALRLQR